MAVFSYQSCEEALNGLLDVYSISFIEMREFSLTWAKVNRFFVSV